MDKRLKNSEDFIKKYASKQSAFSTPKDYFGSVEDTFSMKLREEKLPNNSGFKVPNLYFENLEDTILDRVQAPKTTKVISLRKKAFRLIPIAAAASVMLFIGLNFFNFEKEVTSEEIAVWFENDIYRISSDDISTVFEDIDLTDEETDSSIDINEIENYLESIDTTPLLNEIN